MAVLLPNSRRASAVAAGAEKADFTVGVNLREEICLLIGQVQSGKTSTQEPEEVFKTSDIATKYGAGSPINLMKKRFFETGAAVRCFVLPINNPSSGAAAATANITVTGTSATAGYNLNFLVKGMQIIVGVAKGDTPATVHASIKAAMEAQIDIPFTIASATGLDLTAKWLGTDSNDIYIAVVNDDAENIDAVAQNGLTVTITEFASGSGTADISTAIGNIPESLKITRIITQVTSTTALDLIEQLGLDRRAVELAEYITSYYPYVVDTTDLSTEYSALTALTNNRINDLINSCHPVGCQGMGFEFVSEMVARIAAGYSENPGKPQRNIKMTLPTSTPINNYWFSSEQRDALYKLGVVNYEMNNLTYKLMDNCVHYHPADDNKAMTDQPILFDDEDITAIGNMAYDLLQEFRYSPNWTQVKFIGANDISTNPAARKLSDVKATLDSKIDLYVDSLFLSESQFAKENSSVYFNSVNPERVEIRLKSKMARTGRIFSILLQLSKEV